MFIDLTCSTGAHREIKEMLFAYKTAKTQINMFLLFDFKTVGHLGRVSVRLRGLCLIRRVYRPKF